MANEGPTEVGSIIGYLQIDDSDWDATLDRAIAKKDELGKNNPKIRIEVDNAAAAIAQLQGVKTAEDNVTDSNKKMSSSAKESAGSFQPLLSAIMLLGPTLAPIGVAGAGVFGGLALGAGSVALGIKGISIEMANGSAQGAVYTAGLKTLKGDLSDIEVTAANGLVTPFNQALALAQTLFPTVNSEVGAFSSITGQAAVAVGTGLVGGFVTLRPLLEQVIVDVDHGAVAFENWASSTGGITKFMATAQTDLPIVERDLGEIIAAVLKAGDAFGSTGLTALNALTLVARAINAIPISELDHIAAAVTLGFAAWKGYQVVLLAKSAYDTVSSSIQKAATYLAQDTLQLDANNASASAAGLKNAAFAVSADGVATSLAAETVAADASKDAIAAQALATKAADVSMSALLGPVALAAAGIGALALIFGSSSSGAEKAKATMDSYTSAVEADTGAIGDNIKAQAAKALQSDGADTAAQKLGISTATLLQATLGNADAQAQVKSATDAATAALDAQTAGQGAGRSAVNATSESLDNQRANINLITSSVSDQSAGIQGAVSAYQQWNSAIGPISTSTEALATQQADVNTELGLSTATASQYAIVSGYVADTTKSNYANAVDYARALQGVVDQYAAAGPAAQGLLSAMNEFATSADTDADKAKLLGAVLLASQGDALSYANAVASGYSADSALVTAFQQQVATTTTVSAGARASANDKVTAANERLTASESRLATAQSKGSATTASITSAQSAVASAKAGVETANTSLAKLNATAGTTGVAFADTELGSINLKTSMINLASAGAGPLIQQLQAMQSAAVTAAEATYQNEVATKGTSAALSDAQTLFESMTGGTLVANAKQLGLTAAQAQKLADNYFNVPTDLTTDVQSVGLSTLNDTLNELGTELAHLTGVPWVSTLTADTSQYTSAMDAAIGLWNNLQADATAKDSGPSSNVPISSLISIGAHTSQQHLATGGFMADGWGEVGENGPESFYKSGSQVQVFPSALSGPGITGPAPSPVGNAFASSHQTPAKHVTVQQTIYNPVPEMASVSGPAGLRRAALALGGL